MGRLSRGRANDEGVHARGDGHRPEVARRVRAGVLQVLGPDQVVVVQEEPEDRAAVQQVRGAQGRVENLQNSQTKKLNIQKKFCFVKKTHLRIFLPQVFSCSSRY